MTQLVRISCAAVGCVCMSVVAALGVDVFLFMTVVVYETSLG